MSDGVSVCVICCMAILTGSASCVRRVSEWVTQPAMWGTWTATRSADGEVEGWALAARMSRGSIDAMRAKLAAIGLLAVGLAGCSGGSTSSPSSAIAVRTGTATPVQAAYSWFKDINTKDRVASLAAFVPRSRGQGDWNGGDTSMWPTFKNVKCKYLGSFPGNARVECTFDESINPGEQRDAFWVVTFHHETNGQWLINGYGTG